MSRSSSFKIKFLLLIPTLAMILMMLVACDGIATNIKDKIKSEVDVQLSPPIATMQHIWVGHSGWVSDSLFVDLKPTIIAVANKTYIVSLYEKGNLRDDTVIQWNQPELNISKVKSVTFPISREEYDAYFGEDISHIFSVKVHE
jgi:hypothetical protein